MITRSAIVFACHESSCRPPAAGGTDGSSVGRGVKLTVAGRGSSGKHPGTVNTSKDDHRELYGKKRDVSVDKLIDNVLESRRQLTKKNPKIPRKPKPKIRTPQTVTVAGPKGTRTEIVY